MRVFIASFLAAIAAFSTPAMADPTADLVAMQQHFAAVKSVHTDITGNGQTIAIDMIFPDKVHETLPHGMQLIAIGPDAWIDMNGSWTKLPGLMGQMRSAIDKAKFAGMNGQGAKDYTITDAGPSTVGTIAAEKYHLVSTKDGSVVDMWVGPGHLPVQVQIPPKTGGTATPTTIEYSQYNSVPDITPPV